MLSPLKVATPSEALKEDVGQEWVDPEAPVLGVIDAVTEADDDVITLP